MAANKALIPVLFLLVVLLFGGADGYKLCQIDTNALDACRPAVTPPEHGQPLPSPTEACCTVVRGADLKCLCNFKSALPAMGINSTNALDLPAKCGLPTPPKCRT